MSRVYRVLLPLYRVSEMDSALKDEWLNDCRGQSELSFQLFTKLIFRIAHQWCVHVDLDEYIDFLERLYSRITRLDVYKTELKTKTTLTPIITVSFPSLEKKTLEGQGEANATVEVDDWMECRSNESEVTEYEYQYREDETTMRTKKFKKMRAGYGGPGGLGGLGGAD